MKRPLIMVTNDDGVYSPGLLAAAEVAANFADLLIVAPDRQQTGMGRAFPVTKETGIIDEVELIVAGEKRKAYAVHGSPALSVAHGIMELTEQLPDLCISGINYGENLGTTLTCSGTLGAAFEANSHGVPGIAISVFTEYSKHRSSSFDCVDWKAAQVILDKYIRKVLSEGMPEGVDIWNINVPGQMEPPYTYRITSQSKQNYFCFVRPEKRDLRKPFKLKSRLYVDVDSLERDSDIYTVYVDHKISVTPLSLTMSTVNKNL